MNKIDARNPRKTAEVAAAAPARVLEPSPPAVHESPWYADDPTDTGGDRAVVTPTSAGATTWADLVEQDPNLSDFASRHWLAAFPELPAVPTGYRRGLEDYHRLAYGVVSNARKQANGKIGLRYTHGGFGTPFFGDDEQVRVGGTELIVQRGTEANSEPITTLSAAASFVGAAATDEQAEHDTVPLGDVERLLEVSEEVGAFLGSWFGFGTAVLEEARLLGSSDDEVSRVQIWPGHFDPAVEMGSLDDGRRATYGASPGDATHDEPYLYVASWGEIDRSERFWNDEGFNGGSLSYQRLTAASDPRALALDFFGHAYDLLHR